MTAARVLGALAHHWVLVTVATLALVTVVAVVELTAASKYRSSVMMQVQAPADTSGAISLQATLSARERAVTITMLANTWSVARRARAQLSGGGAGIHCSFAQDGQSEYLKAVCTGSDAHAVARGAEAFAAALQTVLDLQRSQRLEALRALYREQVASLREAGVPATDFPAPPAYPTSPEVAVVDAARVPRAPYAPRPKRAIAIALVLGLILNGGLAFLLERMQNRARTPDELRAALGEPVLVSIPKLREGVRT